MLNLYLISQEVNNDYDTYDSAVVVAENEDAAKKIHPRAGIGNLYWDIVWNEEQGRWLDKGESYINSDWADLGQIQVKLIGVATEGLEAGTVVCSSFNAG